MSASGPTDMRLVIEQSQAGFAKGVDILVHILCALTLMLKSGFIGLFESLLFLIAYAHFIPKAQAGTINLLDLLPTRFLFVLE